MVPEKVTRPLVVLVSVNVPVFWKTCVVPDMQNGSRFGSKVIFPGIVTSTEVVAGAVA
jgi:hypothetical protein